MVCPFFIWIRTLVFNLLINQIIIWEWDVNHFLVDVFFLLSLLFWLGIDETIELIRANGGTCVGYKVDISKKEEVYKAADAIRRDVGDVSIHAVYTKPVTYL